MTNQFLVIPALAFLLWGCSAGLKGGARVTKESQSDGSTIFQMYFNQLQLESIEPPKPWPIWNKLVRHPYNYLDISPRKIVRNDAVTYELCLHYKDELNEDNFLGLSNDTPLVIEINGETHSLPCKGHIRRRRIDLAKTPARVRQKVLIEEADYRISAELLWRIAEAHSVRFTIRGGQNTLIARFEEDNFLNFGDFCGRYVFRNSIEKKTGKVVQ